MAEVIYPWDSPEEKARKQKARGDAVKDIIEPWEEKKEKLGKAKPWDSQEAKEKDKYRTADDRPLDYNETKEGFRAFAQGVTFGFADEIEGKIQSWFGDESYEQARDRLRRQNAVFRKENPKTALALELAGGLAIPGLGAGRLATQGALKATGYGAGQASLYGAGSSESDTAMGVASDALNSAKFGAGAAFGLNRLSSLIAPAKVNANAQRLLDEGVDLTPGQAMGGIANKFENSLDDLPFIKSARDRSLQQYNRATANQIAKPYGGSISTKLDDGLDLSDVAGKVKKSVDKAYDDALVGATLKNTQSFKNSINQIKKNAIEEGADKDTMKVINQFTRKLTKQTKGAGVKDQSIKHLQMDFNKQLKSIGNSDKYAHLEAFKHLKNLKTTIKEEIKLQNPHKLNKLDMLDKSYGDYKAFVRTIKGNEVFTPKQFKAQLGKGVNPDDTALQKALQEGQTWKNTKGATEVLSDLTANSGTASRLTSILTTAGLLSPVIGGLSMGALKATGAIMAIPAVSTMMYNPKSQKVLADWLRRGKTHEQIANLAKKYVAQEGATITGILQSDAYEQ